MRNVTQKEFRELIVNDHNAIILDVRRPDEWMKGVIDQEVMMLNVLDRKTFEAKVIALENTKNYYVYCRSGRRSVSACKILEAAGIENTYNLLGGMLVWEDPIVAPDFK
jgi:rhodanese-related sulfurtransferase